MKTRTKEEQEEEEEEEKNHSGREIMDSHINRNLVDSNGDITTNKTQMTKNL